jgi:hypothetical protein
MTTSPDAYDDALSAIRGHVDDLGAWLVVWANRQEPDAHARRCAGDAVGAVDAMLGHLYGVRTHLVSGIRKSDDQAAARADALLRGHVSTQTASDQEEGTQDDPQEV